MIGGLQEGRLKQAASLGTCMIGRLLLCGMFCIAWVSPAAADYSGGMAASRSERYFEAYHQFRSTAEAGEVESQYMLGRLYAEGYGVRQDLVKAYKWFSRSEEHTSELQSLMRISNAVFCLK